MGKSDHCAVWGCDNDRRYPEKYVVKEHIAKFDGSLSMRFWSSKPQHFNTWSKMINREVVGEGSKKRLFRVTKYTKVCSNHFVFGRPTDDYPHPMLFLRGYDGPTNPPKRRTLDRTSSSNEQLDLNSSVQSIDDTACKDDLPHQNEEQATAPSPVSNNPLAHEIAEGSSSSFSFSSPPSKPMPSRLSWEQISSDVSIIKLYTGCPTAKAFMFIVNRIRPKHGKVAYYKGKESDTVKRYQHSPSKPCSQKKPGPSRQLKLEDEILLTLMRIRLDSPVADLAFRFQISPSHASKICTTFIVLLARELEPLIYWPTPEETLAFQHPHFKHDFVKVEGIGDCTEQFIQKPFNSKAQYQTYSTYKSRNTHKKLIFCTKGGSISFVSKSYSGSASDRFITEDCNVVNKFTPGFIALFDKGFTVQDIFLPKQVLVKIPPFARDKKQFTPSEIADAKRIARARIHVERVMGRLKEFRLLDHTLPLSLLDLIDDIWTIAAAITNLQPPLVISK